MRRLVLCLNLDTVKNKNLYQFEALSQRGFRFLVFGYEHDRTATPTGSYEYQVYPRKLLPRLLFTFRRVWSVRRDVHHVELYMGGGSFLGLEYLLCKLLGLRVCVVERGSPLLDLNRSYGRLARRIRRMVYRRADAIWIRELWMKDSLAALGRREHFFLSNAIRVSPDYAYSAAKPIDFVWCNSMKDWRNSDWFVDALAAPELRSSSAVMLGFLEDNPTVQPQQEYVSRNARDGIELLPFQPPSEYFLRSRFFVLPADIVYLNFALLEAMSHGVVPIVSDVEGAREIVVDGESGLLAPHSREGLFETMIRARNMSADAYVRMSANARRRVIEKFSIERWADELVQLYRDLGRT